MYMALSERKVPFFGYKKIMRYQLSRLKVPLRTNKAQKNHLLVYSYLIRQTHTNTAQQKHNRQLIIKSLVKI